MLGCGSSPGQQQQEQLAVASPQELIEPQDPGAAIAEATAAASAASSASAAAAAAAHYPYRH